MRKQKLDNPSVREARLLAMANNPNVRFTDMPGDKFDHCPVCGKPLSVKGELLVCECGRIWNQRGIQIVKAPPKRTRR
jgi:hypothetical protein